MHGCRFFLIIVRLGHGYCRLLRQQSGGQVVRQKGKVARGCKKGGAGRTRKGAFGEVVGYWAACVLLFARVLHGYVFAWLLF